MNASIGVMVQKQREAADDLLERRVEAARAEMAMAEDQIRQASMRPLELSTRMDARARYIKAARELATAIKERNAQIRGVA